MDFISRVREKYLGKVGTACFYLAVFIETIMVIIDKSAYTNPIEGLLFRITFLLFAVKVISTKYSLKEWCLFVAVFVIGSISYLATGRNEIIRIATFIMAFKQIDLKQCLKLVFWLTAIGIAVLVALACGKIYGSIALTQDYGRGAVETRYTLGLGHPNALQCMVWVLCILGVYLYFNKMRWYLYLVLAGLQTAVFLLTDSRTGFAVGLLSLGMAFGMQYGVKIRDHKIIRCGTLAITCGSIGISVLAAGEAYRLYNYVWHWDRTPVTMVFWYLNKLLNGRIYGLINSVNWEGAMNTWRLFSTPDSNYYFDMGWVRLFYWYGIIPGILFCLLYLLIHAYCSQKKDYMAVVLFATFAVYSIVEAHIFSVYIARNYVLFLMASYIWTFLLERAENKSIKKEVK